MSYVSQIVDYFLELRSGEAILDSADYTIIAEWEKQDIPLDVVLTAISEASPDGRNGDPVVGSVASLQDRIQKSHLNSLQA